MDFRPVKLYSDRSHYSREHRPQLSDLLRPYWKDAPFNDEQRRQMYGVSCEDFVLAPKLADADVAILPMTWNHYLARRQLASVASFVGAARKAARPVLSYVSGDEGVTVPSEFDDVWVARASGYRSLRRKRQVAQPVFFDDPLERYAKLNGLESEAAGVASESVSVTRRPSAACKLASACAPAVPSVGFCGQASVSALKLSMDVIRCAFRNGVYHTGLRQEEPQRIYPPALLRFRALRILRRSPFLRTEFIIRSRYRAGAVGAAATEKTSREFYENILRTDYTLCVRGGGNFSKRLYETLAIGRIPLLIDTDCLLPLESVLPWAEAIVRVPSELLRTLPEKVAEHFARHNGPGLAELKQRCRQLWEDSLSFRGFHGHLIQLMLGSAGRVDENG